MYKKIKLLKNCFRNFVLNHLILWILLCGIIGWVFGYYWLGRIIEIILGK
jgi:uncharacterized membrane protein YpjA